MTRQRGEHRYEYQARLRDGSQWRAGCLYAVDPVHVRLKLLEQLPPGAWIIHAQPIHRGPWNSLTAWSSAQWIALASIVIALVSLWFSMYQGSAIRQHQRMSMRPWLQIDFRHDTSGAGFVLARAGTGPALIRSFEVFVDGKPQSDWSAVRAALGLPDDQSYRFSLPIPGILYMPGSDLPLFWFEPSSASALLIERWVRLDIVVCYCSLYDECWRLVHSHNDRVQSCTPLSNIQFRPPRIRIRIQGEPQTP
jgi:hypothetical protein